MIWRPRYTPERGYHCLTTCAAQQFKQWTYDERKPVRSQAAHLARLTHLWLLARTPSADQVAERVIVDWLLRALPRTLRRPVSMRNPLDIAEQVEAVELAEASIAWALRIAKAIPYHQSSFCWICLPLLTPSIIRSSCPPSHHWTSLGFHFAGLNPISLVGPSRWPGEGMYPKHINWSLGFPRARFLDPSSSPHTLHHWVPSCRHMASPTISTLMTHSSISHFDQMIQR